MNSQLSFILNEVKKSNWHYTETLCWDEIKKDKHNYTINKILALCLLMQKKIAGAKERYKFLLLQKEDDFDVLNNLSKIYLEEENFVEADRFIDKCLSINPDKHHPYIHKSEILFKLRNFSEAYKFSQKAINLIGSLELVSQNSSLVQLHTDLLLALNENELAIKFIKKCFEISKRSFYFYYLTNLEPNSYSEDYIQGLIDNFNKFEYLSLSQKNIEGAQLYFGIARFYEKINRNKSEEFFIKANELASLVQRYQPLEHQKKIKKIINYYKNNHQQDFALDNSGENLIFIVGMPRSGTTLLESIIASNTKVFSAGELTSVPRLLNDSFEQEEFTEPNIKNFSQAYFDRSNFLKGSKVYFLDKLTINYFYVGIISMAFPKAKFIHIKRDPWDTAVSLFKQTFISNLPFASKFFSIACQIANYQYIMNFWNNQACSKNILNITYEDLVQNDKDFNDKIFEFLNLENHNDDDENDRQKFFSRTASKIQIKQGIHQKSVKKTDFIAYRDEFFRTIENQSKYWEIN